MIEKDVLEQLKEKTQLDYERAVGIWDLALGLLIVVFGVQISLNITYSFGIFGAMIISGMREFQKKVIYPRLGRAEFNKKGKKQEQLFWTFLFTMLFLSVFGLTDYWTGTMKFYLSMLCVLLIIIGGFSRRTIFYIYSCAMFLPLILGLFITNSLVMLMITVATLVLTYILLKRFVYDWTGLEQAKTRAGITAHFFVGFAALGLAGYLTFKHFNPQQTASIIAQMNFYKYFYAGVATAAVVFIAGFALQLKNFYWYAVILVVLSIVWRLQLLPRPYFIGVFMLFGVVILGYRLVLLRKFLRENPVLDRAEKLL